MPCEYESPLDRERRQRNELDKLTRMLCETCKQATRTGITLRPEVRAWWEQHQKADARRLEEEAEAARQDQLRNQALTRLSDEERKALGW